MSELELIESLQAERDVLAAQRDEVLAIHERCTPDLWTGTNFTSPPFDCDYCPRCRVNWPCSTAIACGVTA